VLGDDPRLIDVRPIGAFARRLAALPALARVVVAGGGAGGVELAFALRNRAGAPAAVTLVAGGAACCPALPPRCSAGSPLRWRGRGSR
jgi:NADH dehydrogenase FAD-containing subunit